MQLARSVYALVLLTSGLHAQTEIGGASLNGTISDPSGSLIAGAKVTVKSPATGLTRNTTTTNAGLYNFSRLPVGTYDLSVEMQGFKSLARKGIDLAVGATVTLDLKMELGAVSETVSVTSEAPIVEATRTASSTTVSQRAVADLPVNGRNFIDFTTLTPGVVKDPTRGGDLSFGGQRGPSNSLLVDGADSNNLFFGQATGRTGFRPYAFSQDAVQEFQVNSSSYPAEVGRAGGGSINVITKSGTNDYHGTAFWFYRDKGLNTNTFVNNRVGAVKNPYHYNQFGGSLGGPVKKNKLFFFFNYDGQRNTATQIVVPNIAPTGAALDALKQYLTPYPLKLDNNVYLGKADWNASDRDRVSVRFNASRYNGVNFESNGLASAAEHTGNNKVSTNNLATTYTRVIGTSTVWESRFNYVGDKQPGEANATGPEVIITNGVTFGKNNFSPRFTNSYTYQPTTNVSIVRGSHTFKAGVDFDFQRIENYFPGLFAGQYLFANYAAFLARTPVQFTQAFSGTSSDVPISHPNLNEFAFFAQDSWRVNDRLTLNLGLRYDLFLYNQPTTRNTDAGLAALGLRTDLIPNDKNNLGPRFGFAYKVGGGDKVVVRGGYGMFYARVPGLLLSTAILQNGIDVRNYTFTSNLPTYPNIFAAVPPGAATTLNIFATDPNFRSPLTQQFSLQTEWALGKDYSLTAGYLGVNASKLTRSRDLNLFPSQLATGTLCPTNAVCAASEGTSIQYWRHPGVQGTPARPNPAFGRITLFESAANSVYHGGFLQLTKRFSRNFQLLTSYTYSHVIDSAPDGTAVVVGSDDSKIAQDTLAPNLERGNGSTDITHRFVMSGVWDINYAKSLQSGVARRVLGDWQLSMIMQHQSGRVFNIGASGDPNNDGNTNDRSPYVGRNTYRGPNFQSWDVRVTKDVALVADRVRLRFIGEAFNLTNRANFNGIQVGQLLFGGGIFRPTTNFGATQSNFDPRIVQLALKLMF